MILMNPPMKVSVESFYARQIMATAFGDTKDGLMISGPQVLAENLSRWLRGAVQGDWQQRNADYRAAFAPPAPGEVLPAALLLTRPGESLTVPFAWTSETVTFQRSPFSVTTEVIALNASGAAYVLAAAIQNIACAFFDRRLEVSK